MMTLSACHEDHFANRFLMTMTIKIFMIVIFKCLLSYYCLKHADNYCDDGLR